MRQVFQIKPEVAVFTLFFFLAATLLPWTLTQAQFDASTSVTVLLVCGDGFKDVGEACDPPDFGGATCQSYGFAEGDLDCANDCSAIFTNLCNTCGNGVKEGFEQCDGSDFGSTTCSSFGYNSGTLSCAGSCNVNIMNCSSVGLTEPGTAGSQGGNPGGGGMGGTFMPGSQIPPKETKVIVIGKAYPASEVNVLLDGKVIGVVKADAKADFRFETNQITPGVVGLGLWAEDARGLRSALLTLTFRVASEAVTTVSGAYLAPSIDIDKPIVSKGEILKIFGTTVPDGQITVTVNSETEVIKQTNSGGKGDWTLNFDTSPLADEEYHIARAAFELKTAGNVIKSGYSKAVNFYVGKAGAKKLCEGADLNGDGKVNLVDFSILLYYWNTNNACADQNHDGKVNLIDFSIMLYNWTG